MRKWFSIISALVFLLVILAIAGVWQFKRVLTSLQIESFQYQLETLNLHRVTFSEMSFVHKSDTKQHTIHAHNLVADWQWQSWFSPQLGVVSAEQLNVVQAALSDAKKTPVDNSKPIFSLPENWSVPEGFPERIKIQKFTVKLSCAAVYCTFSGMADAAKIKTGQSTTGINFKLKASSGERLNSDQQLMLDATYTTEQNSPTIASASGETKALTGHWMLAAKISEPLVIANLGEFSGDINIDLDINAGKLNRYALVAYFTVKEFVAPASLQMRGIGADAIQLNVKSNMDSAVNLSSLPIDFSGSTQGAIQTNLAGQLLVDTATKKITIKKLDLTAKAKQLKPTPEIQLDNLSADVHANGYWQPDKFELNLSVPNQVSADVLAKSLSVSAKAAQFSTSKLTVSGNIAQGAVVWPELKFTTEAQLKGAKFQHPQANVKTWYWRGKVQGALADFEINGDLGVGSSLLVTHKVQRKTSELILDWQMPDIFLLAANPFVDTLAVWPPLLTLSRGKINSSGNLIIDLEKNKLTKSKTDVQFSDVSGVYDTLVFQGLSSQIKVITNGNKLEVSTDKLSVNHINKGFDFGPLLAAGRYKSTWERLMQGKLDLQSFSGSAMGGSISTAAQQFDFSQPTQNVKLELKDINLANLLKQYSPGELSGTGLLSGSVPVEINSTGISIAQGMVAAAEAGGRLQMKSARASAMAKNQPSMKLVVDALDDFHYTALASQINYDEKGKLLLSVKLEGRNPALEHGRPIHLNLNLEEDVPAMLASLQLSSKVSDIVKKRLQSRVQKKAVVEKK
jgi:hypothetical protein